MEGDAILTGPLGHDFTSLAEALAPLAGQEVLFLPNPGNAGDNLIAVGAMHFFKAIGLKPKMVPYDGTYPDANLIFGGGGNFIELYGDVRDFFLRNKDSARSIILLPHTVRGNEDLLAELGGNCTLFAREASSEAHLREHVRAASVRRGHDMAFFCDLEAVKRGPTERPGLDDLRSLLLWKAKVARRRLLWRGTGSPDGRILNSFRDDAEKTNISLPCGNVDLSYRYQYFQDMSLFMSERIVRALLKAIEPYETVRSNRLHIVILAAMMGKQVEAFDNSYGKVGDVCRASLNGLVNVRFMGRPPARGADEAGS